MQGADDAAGSLQALIDELAGLEADGLLADALAQARERVLAELTDAMAASLRRQLGARGREQAPPRAPIVIEDRADIEDRANDEDRADELVWYVYGVIASADAAATEDVPGIDARHPAGALAEGTVAAVVSHVPLAEFEETTLRTHLSDMAWVEATARAHERALELVGRRTTVIPMRMCSVYSSEDGVREMLRRERRTLADGLARLEGRTEWGVKAFADSRLRQAHRAGPASPAEPETSPGAGAAYLARRREERDAAQRLGQLVEEASRQIHERLGAMADDGRAMPLQQAEPGGSEMILNGVYLVADANAGEFHEQVRDLRATFGPLGVELRQTGPWPPYNFVPGTIGTTW